MRESQKRAAKPSPGHQIHARISEGYGGYGVNTVQNGPNWEALGVPKEEADRMRAEHAAMPYLPTNLCDDGPWVALGQSPGHWYQANKDNFRIDPHTLERCESPDHAGPGIYFLYLNDDLVYVGRSRNISQRINYHMWQRLKEFDSVATISVPELFIDDVESHYIRTYRPRYNVMGNL